MSLKIFPYACARVSRVRVFFGTVFAYIILKLSYMYYILLNNVKRSEFNSYRDAVSEYLSLTEIFTDLTIDLVDSRNGRIIATNNEYDY